MKHFFVLFSLLIFASCSGIKQISSDDITYPNWISSRPISNDYYIGIAKSSKLQPDYEAIAKQNSLADLSSEISVNLSSESIFHQVDKGDSYREEYQALIQVESKKNLEGYTRIASWENETEYWLYYQLSISEWELIRNKRIKQAVEDAYGYYKLAKKYSAENKFVSSVHYAIKGLDLLKLYMNESLTHSELEQPIDVLCFEFLSDTHGSVDYKMFSGTQNMELLLMGYSNTLDPVEVSIGKSDIPFKVRSSIKGVPGNLNSNIDGLLSISLKNADVNRPGHFVQFTLDWDTMLRDANASVWLRSLLSFPENTFKVSIKTLWPKIAVSSQEFNLSESMNQSILLNETINYLKNKGFDVVEENQADFLISITANTRKGTATNTMHTSLLEYEFIVKSPSGSSIYQLQKRELKGVQASFYTAGINAYERSLDDFKWDVLRDFLKSLEGS
jgi:hypothetical protein